MTNLNKKNIGILISILIFISLVSCAFLLNNHDGISDASYNPGGITQQQLDTALTSKQNLAGILTALSGLPLSSNKMIHVNGVGVIEETSMFDFGAGLVALTTAGDVRSYIGLGTASTQASSAFATTAQGTKADSALQTGTAATNIAQDSTHRFVTDTEKTTWNTKQDALVSGTNIKTVGGTSILGSGNISVGTGTVTSIIAGTGLSGGTITTSGTISLSNTGTSGTFDSVTTDPQGRITAGTNPDRDVAYEGIIKRLGSFPIFKSGIISSGVIAVHLTSDGTAGGVSLCVNGVIKDSVQAVVNDGSALYPMSWLFSNSDKTLTFTTNKASATGVISLLGLNLLGAPVAAANGSVIKITVWCY